MARAASQEGKKASGSKDAPAPFVSVDVLDVTAGFERLGPQHFALTGVWTHHEVSVVVPSSRQSHVLDLSLVVGGAHGGLLLDGVEVTGPLSAEPAAATTGGAKVASVVPEDANAAKALAEAIVAAENTTGVTLPRSQIFATGFEAGEPAVQLAAADATAARLQAPLARAAHNGRAGALLELLRAPSKPRDVKLLLEFRASAGRLAVSFWARAASQEGKKASGSKDAPAALRVGGRAGRDSGLRVARRLAALRAHGRVDAARGLCGRAEQPPESRAGLVARGGRSSRRPAARRH